MPQQQPQEMQAQPGMNAEELAEIKKIKEELDAHKKAQDAAKDEANAALQAQLDEMKKA